MNSEQFHQVLIRFEPSFRACFPALTDEDLRRLQAGPRETLLLVLHERYGYTNAQARAAWNEFVLRYVDGQTTPAENDLRSQQPLNLHRQSTYQPSRHRLPGVLRSAWIRVGCCGIAAKKLSLL